MDQIIISLLDSDIYKFTTQSLVFHQYPNVHAKYTFINRGGTKFPPGFVLALRDQIEMMSNLRLTEDESHFLREMKIFKQDYLEYLQSYHFDPSQISATNEEGDLKIEITGPWHETCSWEVTLMAVISELYYKLSGIEAPDLIGEGDNTISFIRTTNKAKRLADIGARYSDFGTRRRYSFLSQETAVRALSLAKETICESYFQGTSNPYLAMKYGLKTIGTVPHELFSAMAGIHGYTHANKKAMDAWIKEYNGELGIMLPDTFTTDVFLRSFDSYYARVFDGVRQDSFDALTFVKKMIDHYIKLRIDPTTKTIVFSDSLNIDLIENIEEFCKGKIRTKYGIGTNFSADVGVKPLNIVIKLTSTSTNGQNWIPVVKLSDVTGKHCGDLEEIKKCIEILGIFA